MKNGKNGNGGQKTFKTIRFGEYQGNPLIVLGAEETRYPFQFGKGKAAMLLEAMKEMGDAEFRAMLEKFVG